MDEKKHKRGLDDISHFFLSGKKPPQASENGHRPEKPTVETNLAGGGNGTKQQVAHTTPSDIGWAQPCDAATHAETDIVNTVQAYLKTIHSGAFVSVKSIHSSQFGAPDVTLYDKEEGAILCGQIQKNQRFSDFFLSSLGYYTWLKESLAASSPFFEKSPRVLLYLFCDRFQSLLQHALKPLKEAFPVRIIRYQLLQVPDRPAPIITFQPLSATGGGKSQAGYSKAAPPETPRRQHVEGHPANWASSPQDMSKEAWQAFNRLKERAFKE